jgi:hypothetical protein
MSERGNDLKSAPFATELAEGLARSLADASLYLAHLLDRSDRRTQDIITLEEKIDALNKRLDALDKKLDNTLKTLGSLPFLKSIDELLMDRDD